MHSAWYIVRAQPSVASPLFNPSRREGFILFNQDKAPKSPPGCPQVFLALSKNKPRKVEFGERTISTTRSSLGMENCSIWGEGVGAGDTYLFNLKVIRYYYHSWKEMDTV